jgi:hypothetical protein
MSNILECWVRITLITLSARVGYQSLLPFRIASISNRVCSEKVGVAKPRPGNAATLPITVDDGKGHPRMKRFYLSFSLVETKTNYYF